MLCSAAQAEVITVGCLTGDTFIQEDGSERVKWEKIPDCDPALDAFKEGAIADIVSTASGLAAGLVESNPAGLVGGLAIKAGLYIALKNTEQSPRRDLYAYRAGAFQWGLAASNVCMIFAPVQALCAVVGTVTYFNKMEGVKND